MRKRGSQRGKMGIQHGKVGERIANKKTGLRAEHINHKRTTKTYPIVVGTESILNQGRLESIEERNNDDSIASGENRRKATQAAWARTKRGQSPVEGLVYQRFHAKRGAK